MAEHQFTFFEKVGHKLDLYKWIPIRILLGVYNYLYRPLCLILLPFRLLWRKPRRDYRTYFSAARRDVEIREEDLLLEQAIFTIFFTGKKDPQHGIYRPKADVSYIEPWYNSVTKLGLKGIILHDGLEEEFIKKYENEQVQFRKCTLGNYSIFEERWFLYYLFLSRTNIQKAFFADGSDVFITTSPFGFITNKRALYIGRDDGNKIRHWRWHLELLNDFKEDSGYREAPTYIFQPVYNAGVVGGERNLLLFFMSRVINLVLMTQTERHKDMALLNLVVHTYFFPRLEYKKTEPRFTDPANDQKSTHRYLVSGFPLNSAFRKYEYDSAAYFIHK